jgi:hypothetical protein
MTETAERILNEIDALPEDEREEVVAALLARLQTRTEEASSEEQDDDSMYASFQVLADAQLQLSPDASETYEDELYGRDDQ